MRGISRRGWKAAGWIVAVVAVTAVVAFVRDRASARGPIDDPAGSPPVPTLSLLVPAYFHPTTARADWDRLVAAGSRAPIIVVVNAATGPGVKVDAVYTQAIHRCVQAGIQVIGYVDTHYGKRPIEQIDADIQAWVRFYPEVSGIFLDAQAPNAENVPLYREIRKRVEQAIPDARVVANPGTLCDQAYFRQGVADTTCVFEQTTGFDKFQPPSWTMGTIRHQLAAIPYKIGPVELMQTYLARAAKLGLGTIYVTDASGENPWIRLPTYWEQEVEAVHRINRRQAP